MLCQTGDNGNVKHKSKAALETRFVVFENFSLIS